MITIATHNGNFHPDDVFAVASLQLLLGIDATTVIRTRDVEKINEAEYVVDVGGEYDHARKRYDHHQNGSPVRENAIPYAGFGLVWRHYGEAICGSAKVAEKIEQTLVLGIDAGDNGVSTYEVTELGVQPFDIFSYIVSFRAIDGTEEVMDDQFMKATEKARELILRLITRANANLEKERQAKVLYEASREKRVLLSEDGLSTKFFIEYPDVEVVVFPELPDAGNGWLAVTVPVGDDPFVRRAYFPQAWAGLSGSDLAEATGMADARFCHRGRHLAVFESKESALKAAELAE